MEVDNSKKAEVDALVAKYVSEQLEKVKIGDSPLDIKDEIET